MVGSLGGSAPRGGDKGLRMSLGETLRLAWADEDIRPKLVFVLAIFAVYALGVHVPVPVTGVDPVAMQKLLESNQFFQLLNTFGGGAFKRLSIFALGLGPYITASIITQVLTMANPAWKKELQEGGEYARRQQNKRTRALTLVLCLFQGIGLLQLMAGSIPEIARMGMLERAPVIIFWTAGAMMMLWLGEQISEKGIGNGVSLLIFAGIVISLPNLVSIIVTSVQNGNIQWFQALMVLALLLVTTWFVVFFTIAQRRIPIQHMRRNYGTKTLGGQTSYLPISVNMAGVIPIIFAISLVSMPSQFAAAQPAGTPWHDTLMAVSDFFYPNFLSWKGYVGVLLYSGLIFAFTYLWNAMVYNVEDIANNLKRSGSYIPGMRPGKQTKDFLDGVISRVTFVGAFFLAAVALTQYLFPLIANIQNLALIGGTSLLIMVSVALETMRQIEANLLIKKYGG
jgi:preprotein translocase subunit SecY